MKPLASLSLDLDDKWTYLKTHGDKGWESYPSYLSVTVPRILDSLRRRSLTITFMIVGQDAAFDRNRETLRSIAEAGHEIGNHSFHHDPWLHLYSEDRIGAELAQAEEHIARATGQTPIGFRGPGYSVSSDVLRVLVRRGYQYDASTLPTFLGPLARAYYFRTTRLSPEERRERARLFGSLRDGLRPIDPYRLRLRQGDLIELPVTTLPVARIPIHLSYALYLGSYSPGLARLYWRSSLQLCRWLGTAPSMLLHPLDFLGVEDAPDLGFFPAMRMDRTSKQALTDEMLDWFAGNFRVVTLREHVRLACESSLPVNEPAAIGLPTSADR